MSGAAMADTTPPDALMRNGTTMVPLRYIGEWLGANVAYNSSTRVINLTINGKTVSLTIGSNNAYIGGNHHQLAAPAMETGGTTYVPLRFVSEAFGAGVEWNNSNHYATIKHPSQDAAVNIGLHGYPRPSQPSNFSNRPGNQGYQGGNGWQQNNNNNNGWNDGSGNQPGNNGNNNGGWNNRPDNQQGNNNRPGANNRPGDNNNHGGQGGRR